MVYRADLGLSAARTLNPVERAVALRAVRRDAYDLHRLCERAGVALRVTGGSQPRVALWNGPGHGRTVDDDLVPVYVVDRRGLPQRDPERAARILEVLAYSCLDYAARESICRRGIFVYPLTPDHGRAWLAEIGRRGGRSRTPKKASASKRNGRRAYASRGGMTTKAGTSPERGR